MHQAHLPDAQDSTPYPSPPSKQLNAHTVRTGGSASAKGTVLIYCHVSPALLPYPQMQPMCFDTAQSAQSAQVNMPHTQRTLICADIRFTHTHTAWLRSTLRASLLKIAVAGTPKVPDRQHTQA